MLPILTINTPFTLSKNYQTLAYDSCDDMTNPILLDDTIREKGDGNALHHI